MWVVDLSFANQDCAVLFCAVFHAVSVDSWGSCPGTQRLAPVGWPLVAGWWLRDSSMFLLCLWLNVFESLDVFSSANILSCPCKLYMFLVQLPVELVSRLSLVSILWWLCCIGWPVHQVGIVNNHGVFLVVVLYFVGSNFPPWSCWHIRLHDR